MRILFAILSITLLSVAPNKTNLPVCLAASQARIFPLGITDKGLLVVETRLGRAENLKDANNDEMKPYWGGICYLKIYDKHHTEIASTIIDTLKTFKQQDYERQVYRVFEKGMKIAAGYPNFKPAKPVAITFADYQQKCSMASIAFDTINNKINIQLKGNAKYPITILNDATSVAANLIGAYGFENEVMAKDLNGNLGINSVRQFTVANKKLSIVHLGTGNGIGAPGKEYKANFAFNDINKSVFFEPVLHHGNGFDFFIWE
jgi:hypothetical protein